MQNHNHGVSWGLVRSQCHQLPDPSGCPEASAFSASSSSAFLQSTDFKIDQCPQYQGVAHWLYLPNKPLNSKGLNQFSLFSPLGQVGVDSGWARRSLWKWKECAGLAETDGLVDDGWGAWEADSVLRRGPPRKAAEPRTAGQFFPKPQVVPSFPQTPFTAWEAKHSHSNLTPK